MAGTKNSSAFDGRQPIAVLPPENARAGLAALFRAYTYAQDAGVELWEFALEISELYKTGMTVTDLRWLVAKGLAEHGHETTALGYSCRSFDLGGSLNFKSATCFTLTRTGALLAANLAAEFASSKPSGLLIETAPSTTGSLVTDMKAAASQPARFSADEVDWPVSVLKPRWDERCRELWMADRIVKRFRVPAKNQEAILLSFEEEGWPQHIDDPLPRRGDCHPATRLHDAIIRLNGRQINSLLRFRGNGNANGVLWQPIAWDTAPGWVSGAVLQNA